MSPSMASCLSGHGAKIEEREDELVSYPAALEQMILPMLRQLAVEKARFIWGWDGRFREPIKGGGWNRSLQGSCHLPSS